MNENQDKKPEMKFCRLCGKNRPSDDFCDIILARNAVLRQQIVYGGCKACDTVVHNVRVIVNETLNREQKHLRQEAEKKIVSPESKLFIPGREPIKLN